MRTLVFIPLLLFSSWSVTTIFAQEDENASSADTHLAFADSLETAGSFQGAALVYKMIAELYPHSAEYAAAIRNLGHLYVNPFNTARNDSIALYWFRKHLEIPTLIKAERRRSVIVASLIRDRMQGAFSKDRRDFLIDSLTTLARIQESELNAQADKIAELTSELYQTDIDLQILLDFQKNPAVAKQEPSQGSKALAQKIAAKPPQAKKKPELLSAVQSDDQLRKLREIDLRALQRRAKR